MNLNRIAEHSRNSFVGKNPNTITLSNNNELTLTKTVSGRIYKAIKGNFYISNGNKHQVFDAIYSKINELNVKSKTSFSNDKVKKDILKDFDKTRKVFIAFSGNNLENLKAFGLLKKEIQENLKQNYNKEPTLTTSYKDIDFATHVTSEHENELIKQIDSKHALNAKVFFEMIQKSTNDIKQSGFSEKKIQINDSKFKYLELSAENDSYKFLGHAVDSSKLKNIVSLINNHQINGSLCVSLVDQQTNFFQDWAENKMFVIMSVPPDVIVHTLNADGRTPLFNEPEHNDWYNLNAKANVLADKIDTLYKAYTVLVSSPSGFSSDIDKYLRLRNQVIDNINLISNNPSITDENKKSLISLLSQPHKRLETNSTIILDNALNSTNIENKDKINISSLFVEMKKFEQKIAQSQNESPVFKSSNNKKIDDYFADFETYESGKINRPTEKLQKMINFFSQPNIENEKQKNLYINMFGKDDPSKEYNILEELRALEEKISQLPESVGSHSIHLNEKMTPSTILSETKPGTHNEINLELTDDKQTEVKALLLNVNSLKNMDQNELEMVFKFAKETGLQVLVRKSPNQN